MEKNVLVYYTIRVRLIKSGEIIEINTNFYEKLGKKKGEQYDEMFYLLLSIFPWNSNLAGWLKKNLHENRGNDGEYLTKSPISI